MLQSRCDKGIKLKLLFVVNSHEYTARHRLPLLVAAKAQGFQVKAVAPINSDALKVFKASKFEVLPIKLSRHGKIPAREIGSINMLRAIYRKECPDIVHHATIKPVIYGSIAAKGTCVKGVINAVTGLGHVYTNRSIRSASLRWIVTRLYKLALGSSNQFTIFQNQDDFDYFISKDIIDSGRASVIPGSGVDVDYFTPPRIESSEQTVLFVGRMLWEKGVGEFVKAARIVKSKRPSVKFLLVGEEDRGSPNAVSESTLENWNKEGIVHWLGKSSNVRDIYRNSSMVVLPSYYREGLPKVLLEAGACERPVVTTDSPGCRHAVLDGKTGYVVPPKDSVALANAILSLIDSPEDGRRLGKAGRQYVVERFSTERVIEETFRIYREILGGNNVSF